MRPLVTWLLVGALLVIGLFAARDALQSEGTAAEPAPPTESVESASQAPAGPPDIPGRLALVTELKELGARGALYVTDVSCRRFILSLPTLAWTSTSELPGSRLRALDPPAQRRGYRYRGPSDRTPTRSRSPRAAGASGSRARRPPSSRTASSRLSGTAGSASGPGGARRPRGESSSRGCTTSRAATGQSPDRHGTCARSPGSASATTRSWRGRTAPRRSRS